MLAADEAYMLSNPPVSQMCSNFFQRHHALDAHTTNFHSRAISQFAILSIKILTVDELFRLAISKSIFGIPAVWPNFFPASLKGRDL